MKKELQNLFCELVKINTPSDPNGVTEKAYSKFKKCADFIADKLTFYGVSGVKVTDKAYVYATIPTNQPGNQKTIGFMAHYDTPTDNRCENVEPQIHNYESGDITLVDGVKITEDELEDAKGHTIITSMGKTTLGCDDKAGVAEIMVLAKYLMENPEISRPNIKLIFNNNEEVGRGTEHLDYDYLSCDYVYCLDDGEVGNIFKENFNAEGAKINIKGIAAHPADAKDKMVNAITGANKFLDDVLSKFKQPENSEKRESYLAVNKFEGNWAEVNLGMLLRAFDRHEIDEMQSEIQNSASRIEDDMPGLKINVEYDQHYRYSNSAEILEKHPELNEKAVDAYKKVGVEPNFKLVRGGFDGVNMSFKGLPTTDLFNGAMNMHGLNEWVSVEHMELSTKMLVELVTLWVTDKKLNL